MGSATFFTTACPRNCYSTCALSVEVEDGRVRRIAAHPDNHATPGGACLKGLSYVERAVSPDRILTPLRRRPGNRELVPVSWDEALSEIVEKLERFRHESGPQSILYCEATGTKGLLNALGPEFWRLFGGYTTTYGDLCWPAGLEATRLTLGANEHNAPWDLVNARLIVLWGKNPAETNIHQMPFIEQAQEQGAKVVVIDPRRTESAERADLLLQPRPGTDGALALALAHHLIANERIDQSFVDRHVLGFPAYRTLVREFTPTKAATVCDLPVEAIENLADLLGTIQPATICAGFGMQRYTNSGQTVRAIIALLALTGNFGRAGAGWQFANLQTSVFDRVKDPLACYPPADPDGIARVSISRARLGHDMLATRNPELRMAWVERANPIPQNPDTGTVMRAFRSLDFLVVVDQFLTDTAREADIVLPAKTLFEQSDIIGAYWHGYIQLKQKVTEPPGEVLPESEIYRQLAVRLGFPAATIDATFPGPEDAAVDAWLERRLQPFPELSLERLRAGPAPAPGHRTVVFSDLRFPTPSGRIELASEEAARRWGVDVLPGFEEPQESVARESEASRRYPLYLMTPNTKNRIHSQFNNLRMIRDVSAEPFMMIHPDDAAKRGVDSGDVVRVFNDRGAFEVEALLDLGLRPGCVAVTNGWWIADGGAVNFCSLGRETDMGHGAAFHDNLVQVEKVSR